MTIRGSIMVALTVAIFLAATTVFAHHSRANFHNAKFVKLNGTLVDFSWRNPHVFLELDVVGDDEETKRWLIEAHSVTGMKRLGWSQDTLEVGMQIALVGKPDRKSGKLFALLDYVLFDDGTRMYAFRDPSAPPPVIEPSKDFSGTWYADRDMASLLVAGGGPPEHWPYTDLGLQNVASYDPEDSPELECYPVGLPKMTMYAYGINWRREQDRIRIQKEHLDESRVIHLDADRAAIEDFGPSFVGTSIGRFESDRHLVVETTNFVPTRWGLTNGIDSGVQKKITEHYQLSEDGMWIDISYTLEDPEYLTAPVEITGRYRKAENREFSASACDPNTAKRHLTRD